MEKNTFVWEKEKRQWSVGGLRKWVEEAWSQTGRIIQMVMANHKICLVICLDII